MTKQFRQGDIFFEEINEIPEKAEVKEDGIIAYGEVTGHAHHLRTSTKAALKVVGAMMYIEALKNAHVDHIDTLGRHEKGDLSLHDTILLPSGKYRVVRQQEYTPISWQQVAD